MKLTNVIIEATKTTKARLLMLRNPKMSIAEAARVTGCNLRSLYALGTRHKQDPVLICPCCGSGQRDPAIFQNDALSSVGKGLLNKQLEVTK